VCSHSSDSAHARPPPIDQDSAFHDDEAADELFILPDADRVIRSWVHTREAELPAGQLLPPLRWSVNALQRFAQLPVICFRTIANQPEAEFHGLG